jgi:alkylation response protein AidB-like acyl-CoA dehydrogenase
MAAIPVLCAYKVGGCRAVFELSVEYSRERMQFQQPIGRFQRVQDHIIRIVNFLDAARWTTYEALWKLDTGRDAAASVHVAKSVASESYMGACDFAHEVHAGIGVMREYGLTLHTKMSRSLYHCLGAPSLHRKQLEVALGLVTGKA